MYLIYSLLLGLGFVLMLPRLLLDAWRHGKYISGLGERLGNLEEFDHHRPVIWLHCVSVGEVQAARPLFQALRREFPNYSIAVSTVTVTGQRLARELFQNEGGKVFYFPLDWRWTVRRVLRNVRPALVLIMETELWPNFLFECREQATPIAIVNGRLSERSFKRYKLVRRFIARVLDCLDLAVMQTEADAARLRSLGLQSERVLVSGNMKFDAGTTDQTNSLTKELAARFQLGDGQLVLLAASTHEPEERIVLEVFNCLRSSMDLATLRLIIAPRHPERFAIVAGLLDGSNLSWCLRSAAPAPADNEVDVILLDSIGELKSLFPLASLVFVGGSIAPIGGHNVLEPAAAGAAIVTGPYTQNFDEIVRTFTAKGALIQITPANDNEMVSLLSDVCAKLLRDPERRRELAVRAAILVEENRGATARTMQILKTMLKIGS
ncbi:MAG: hypothetical protein JWM21_4269 [Acidobacteria bacterium]|nr:hypothetical protein [Acidobacteriota bacterium]